MYHHNETNGPLTVFGAAETTILQTRSGTATATQAIAESIGSESISRQLLSNAVQQGAEDALLDRVEDVIKRI